MQQTPGDSDATARALRPIPSVTEALCVEHLRKNYGANTVLRDINFTVQRGEIAALLGENGAGKSSLAKILAGSIRADGGTISIAGQTVELHSPREALKHGIAFIPQELIYVPDLSVAENICLGSLGSSTGLVSRRAIDRRAQEIAQRFGIEVPMQAVMRHVSVAVQQKVEILKALSRDSSLLILDEPTAALTNDEADELMTLVRSLAETGLAVLFISHRLDEVKTFCRTAHVLRDGELVASREVASATVASLVTDMLGREPSRLGEREPSRPCAGEVALKISDFSVSNRLDPVTDFNLELAPSEIVTVYGRRGAGADTLAECLTGTQSGATGTVEILGQPHAAFASPRAARAAGLGSVPAERKSQGLLLRASVSRNITQLMWSRLARAGTLFGGAEAHLSADLISRFGVRCRGGKQDVASLSGGNQQKVLIASRLASKPKALVLHEPTRGVDVGARVEIHRLLRETAKTGVPMLIVTSDIEEATTVSDRLLVMRAGRIVREINSPSSEDEATALHVAGGGDNAHAS